MLRFVLQTTDRIGMVHEVVYILKQHLVDILAMEVRPRMVFVKTSDLDSKTQEKLWHDFLSNTDIHQINTIDLLPSELKQQQLNLTLQHIQEGILTINTTGKITFWNQAATNLLMKRGETPGRTNFFRLVSDKSLFQKALQTGVGFSRREFTVGSGRNSKTLYVSCAPMKDESNRVIGCLLVLTRPEDILQLAYDVRRPLPFTFDDIIRSHPRMEQLVSLAKTVAPTDATVFITGESGTGKELFARAIHSASKRKHRPFVPINCAAIPESLLESELFGYEGGTFTGALEGGKAGLFEFANGGTLFLDEVGELSTYLQAKLLRVLQEGAVRRIGKSEEIPVNVRIVAATNRPIENMIEKGLFRLDLYFRLNVIPIKIPPLRERIEEIELLARHFLDQACQNFQFRGKRFHPDALKKLFEYSWPGNVRQLQNVVERSVHLCQSEEIMPEHIDFGSYRGVPDVESSPGGIMKLDEAVQITEKKVLKEALRIYGSTRKMAKVLGVSHTTVANKLRQYGLKSKITN